MVSESAKRRKPRPVGEEDFDALVTTLEKTDHTVGSKLTRLSHYTDSAGLYGIITEKKLRATHYKFLNDNTELRWATTIARRVLESKLGSVRGAIAKQLLSEILANLDEDESVFDAYLVCLSSKRDSLSQWRAYGRGKSYCLSLDIAYLKKLEATVAEHHYFFKVLYDEKKQERLIGDAFEQVLRLARRAAATTDEKQSFTWAKDTFEAMLAIFSVFFKHPAFADEAEWRLVLVEPTGEVNFRAAPNKGIVPYLEIALSTDPPSEAPLKSVRLGPGADRTKEGMAVRRFIRQAGFLRCNVFYANAPLAIS